VGYEQLDPEHLRVDSRHQRHRPGRRDGVSVRAAQRDEIGNARPRAPQRWGRLLQPVAQSRIERRHLGRLGVARQLHQINNADITAHHPVNRALQNPAIAHFWNPYTAAERAALDSTIATQAQIIAYIDDFRVLMFLT
jgi:hypothetical protein